ncbi:hypothetical protein HAX54_001248, partial [Datura stramonium]|nr:hypothetical protein [Datura stramonium]
LHWIKEDEGKKQFKDHKESKHARDMCKFGLGFEDPLDDDDPTDDEQGYDNSDLESDTNEGEDSEMGNVTYASTDDED